MHAHHDEFSPDAPEEILEPELPIIDAHHHLWRRGGQYLLDEMMADASAGHRIVATVFCQSEFGYARGGPSSFRPVGETAYMAKVAEASVAGGAATQVCAGIVGFADLCLGDGVEPVLRAHAQAAPGRFCGVRHIAARHEAFSAKMPHQPQAGLLALPSFRRGLAMLQAHDLVFDAWVYHPQLYEVVDLARALPGLSIVLDHVGGPLAAGPYRGRRDEVFAWWRGAMENLSACLNVAVKLGGLGMPIGGFDFHKRPDPPSSKEVAAGWKPYIETCIDLFGPTRCMFESNFPVDRMSCGYAVLWNAYKRITAGASADEKASLYLRTARDVYRLRGLVV